MLFESLFCTLRLMTLNNIVKYYYNKKKSYCNFLLWSQSWIFRSHSKDILWSLDVDQLICAHWKINLDTSPFQSVHSFLPSWVPCFVETSKHDDDPQATADRMTPRCPPQQNTMCGDLQKHTKMNTQASLRYANSQHVPFLKKSLSSNLLQEESHHLFLDRC